MTAAAPLLSALPLLGDEDVHPFVQEAYEVLSAPVMAAVAALCAELVGAGMDTARHLFDWSDFEPSPGFSDVALVEGVMDARLAAGLVPLFCGIVAIDSGGPTVPVYVSSAIDTRTAWGDPLVAMLEATVPAMPSREGVMLSLANKPDGHYQDDPERVVVRSFESVRTLEPSSARTNVFAGTEDAALDDKMPLCDVATFNLLAYELVVDLSYTSRGTAMPHFHSTAASSFAPLRDAAIACAGGRLTCLQDLGQSTGWAGGPQALWPLAGPQ